MLNLVSQRVLNVGLRALAMASRFILIFVLAKFLEPAEVGLYGLFLATIAFSVLVIGGDFYTYSQRELMSLSKSDWAFVIKHQLVAIGFLYVFLLPLQLLIFWFDFLPRSLLVWFIALLFVEHIAQEINRLLVAMQHPILASWILFIRMGAWVAYVVPVMWLNPETRNLDVIFGSWFIGALLAILIGGFAVYREVIPWRPGRIDWAWIKRGFRVAFIFLVATTSFKALTTVDRYIVEYLNHPDLLGVYVLYIGMAMAVVNFLDPAVFSFLYPRAVTAYRQGDYVTYNKVMKEMVVSSIAVTLILALIIAILAPYVLEWIDREAYQEQIFLLWILLMVAAVYGIGLIPHYGLYAKGLDRCIVLSHISSLLIFVITVFLIAPYNPLEATAYALLAAFIWMAIIKSICYFKIGQNDKLSQYESVLTSGNS